MTRRTFNGAMPYASGRSLPSVMRAACADEEAAA